jgi:hypothetical protein
MKIFDILNKSKLNRDIEISINEIQRQLAQGGGYPFSKARLRGTLKNITEGNFLGTAGVDSRFEHIFTTEPLIIPEVNIDEIRKAHFGKGWDSFSSGYFSSRFWKPSSPLQPGSKMQITLYKIMTESFDDCVKFIGYMGGTYPNLQGLIAAQVLIGDRFPKTFERPEYQTTGTQIIGLDKKSHCCDDGHNINAASLKYSIHNQKFEFYQVDWDGTFHGPYGIGHEYLLFYYECD